MSEDYGLIWVCQCCILVLVVGECCADDSHGGDGIEPLSAIGSGYSATPGMGYEDHADGCVNGSQESAGETDCDCEAIPFSHSQCEGCGSYLYGERHAAHLWKD